MLTMEDQFELGIRSSRSEYMSNLFKLTSSESLSALNKPGQEALERLTTSALRNLEERFNLYLTLKDVNIHDKNAVDDAIRKYNDLEHNMMQFFREKTVDQKHSGEAFFSVHHEVLRKIQPLIFEDVNLAGTAIMDRLITDKLMSEDERQSIIQASSSRRQKETFLRLMKPRLSEKSLMENFIPAIEVDHPEVAIRIREIKSEVVENPAYSDVCVVCWMKDVVQAKDLAQHLHANKVIKDGFYDLLRSIMVDNATKWSRLCEKVSDPSPILEALEEVFPEVYKSLIDYSDKDMKCCCHKIFRDESSMISNRPFDVGNNLLGDLESMVGDDIPNITWTQSGVSALRSTKERSNYDQHCSNLQGAHLSLYLDPNGPEYQVLINPKRVSAAFTHLSSTPLRQPITVQNGFPDSTAWRGFQTPNTYQPYPVLPQTVNTRSATSPVIFRYRELDRPSQLSAPTSMYTPLPTIQETMTSPGAQSQPYTESNTLKPVHNPYSPRDYIPQTVDSEEPLTVSKLESSSSEDRRQILGNKLYSLIKRIHPEDVGKITGMIL